jgi:hypothetical protein
MNREGREGARTSDRHRVIARIRCLGVARLDEPGLNAKII